MTGDNSRLPFALLFSLRSHTVRQPALTVLTVLAVATSVALAVALQMSSASVQAEFTRTAECLTGAAQIEVTAGKVGIPEVLLKEVEETPGVLSASPVIQATVRHVGGLLDGEPLHILGVDLLADREIRSYSIISKDLRILDAPMLIASVDSVIVSEVLADRLGIQERDSIPVRSSRGNHRLVVRGILASGGLADAYGGQVAVMDVFSLQQILGREGWIDRIDITVKSDHDVPSVMDNISNRVAGRAAVQDSANRNLYVAATMSTLRLLAGTIAVVGILVAAFLSYGAISVSVDRRIREFALLRGAGFEGYRVRQLVYMDSLVVAVLGTLIGFPIGHWLSRVFLSVFSATLQSLQNMEIRPSPFGTETLVVGIIVGVGVSIVGSLAPARRASIRPPLDVLSTSRRLTAVPHRYDSIDLKLGVVAIAAWLAAWLAPIPISGLLRTAIAFGLGLVATVAIVGPVLSRVLASARPWFEHLLPQVGRLVGNTLRMSINHSRVTVASIAGLLAAISSILVLLKSVAQTIDQSSFTRGGIAVTASDPFASLQRDLVTSETADQIANTPGVRAVSHHFFTEVLHNGETVVLRAISADVIGEHGWLPLLEGGDVGSVASRMKEGGVVVSEAFSQHFGIGHGDRVVLDTPIGPREFPVVGVARGFISGSAGSLRLDINVFDQLWHRDGSSNLIIWVDSPIEEVIDLIRARTGSFQPLFFVRSNQIDRFMRDQIGRYSYLLYSLIALTAGLGGLSVMSLLIGSVAERSQDLALVRAAGGTSRQLFLLVWVDGLIVTTVGIMIGICLGIACSVPMNAILTEEFGWSIEFTLDLQGTALSAAGMLTISALSALYPSWMARRALPTRILAPE